MSNNFWVELKESPERFEQIILEAIGKKIDKAFGKAYTKIVQETKTLVHQALSKSDVIGELTDGSQLRGELGLTSGLSRSAAQAILEGVSNSVQAEYRSVRIKPTSSTGGLTFYIQPENLSNVIDIAQAQISYYSKRYKKAVKLDWLDWLLNQGDRIIVAKFHFEPKAGRGRSGLGEMKKEGMFKIDSQYAGEIGDNFISRAITSRSFRQDLSKLIHLQIGKYL